MASRDLVRELENVIGNNGSVTIFDMLVSEHRASCDDSINCETPPLVADAQNTIRDAAARLALLEQVAAAARDLRTAMIIWESDSMMDSAWDAVLEAWDESEGKLDLALSRLEA